MSAHRALSIAAAAALCAVAASCSSGARSTPGAPCAQGTWVTTRMVAPAQAGVVDPTPTGGGDGADVTFLPDGTFQIDFGPMHPAIASFTANGQPAQLSVQLSGVGKGTWQRTADPVTAGFADLTTVRALATIILGATVPPIFDATWQQIDSDMMLGDAHMGGFTVTSCRGNTLAMTTPFPGGSLAITAARRG